MIEREGRGNIGSFSRGTELWLKQAKFFLAAVRAMLVVAVLSGMITTGLYFCKSMTVNERYALERHLLAYTLDAFFMSENKIEMDLNVNGRLYQLEAEKVMRLTNGITVVALQKLKKGGLWGLGGAIGSGVLVGLYWWRYGKQKITDKRLRGAQLVNGKELTRLMKSRSDANNYQIAGVPMRRGAETLHTLFCGVQGTGKSQQFFSLIKQIRAANKRMIIYDPTGEYIEAFYREGQDILMNPFDARSPNWNIWNEITKDYHFDNIANALIPEPATIKLDVI